MFKSKVKPLEWKASSSTNEVLHKSRVFPSTRFFMAVILCFCFISLSVATSNLSQAMVCMVRKKSSSSSSSPSSSSSSTTSSTSQSSSSNHVIDGNRRLLQRDVMGLINPSTDNNNTSVNNDIMCYRKSINESVIIVSCQQHNQLQWTSQQQGVVYAAQNAGSLFMLLAGWQADRLNGKWTIAVALILLIISNSLIPVLASYSPWLVAFFRVMTGIGDALIFPSASSMITRWFPPKERPFAIGFVTGGRQIGTLLILPIGGIFCEHPMDLGWRAIFYLSAIFGAIILIIWLLFSADKPSKHFCVSKREEGYITRKIGDEKIGKRSDRGSPPWNKFVRCLPLYVAVAAIVCHEYPLVIMLQLLPKYFADVLELSNAANGLISSLPSVVLLISKTISCIVASLITTRKPPLLGSTACCKFFNFIASLGLAVCVGLVPLIGSKGNPVPVILVLCLANAFAGMHTPGVQTALVQLAPAYSGIVTGIAFSFSAVFSIINKMISSSILLSGTSKEWAVVFEISAVVAFLPVVFFTVWGSADVQPWAKNSSNNLEQNAKRPSNISQSDDNVVKALALYSLFLAYNFGAT